MLQTVKTVALAPYQQYRFHLPWNGRQQMAGTVEHPIAIDTETDLIDKSKSHDVPRLALITVASSKAVPGDGVHASILHPTQFGDWLRLHDKKHFVGHNVVFDFLVIDRYLREVRDEGTRRLWWQVCDEGRLHDTMVLDQLLQVGVDGARRMEKKDLGRLVSQECYLEVDKEDPYRLRYAELIGRDWDATVEEGFWTYAVKDALVTSLIWNKLHVRASSCVNRLLKLNPNAVSKGAVERYGLLTESLQVRGAIALFLSGKLGIHVDVRAAGKFVSELKLKLDSTLEVLQKTAPSIFVYTDELTKGGALSKSKRVKPKQLLLDGTPEPRRVAFTKSHSPRVKRDELVRYLSYLAFLGEVPVIHSTGKTGGVSTSAKAWKAYKDVHPFFSAWESVSKVAKTLTYASPLVEVTEIHPRYNPLLITGRAAATKPNLQQMPRSKSFREIFTARAGHKLLTCDYSFIELRTLAYVCEQWYGSSVLADVIRDGRDPHTFTASLMTGRGYDELLAALADESHPEYKTIKNYRQSAKAVNFGVPGGLGAAKLAAYAEASYGVKMSEHDAFKQRKKLVEEVYPELNTYLGDTSVFNLAFNLGLSVSAVSKVVLDRRSLRWIDGYFRVVSRVLRGEPIKRDGTPYPQDLVDSIWDRVGRLARMSTRLKQNYRDMVFKRRGSPGLESKFLGGIAITPTGRLRSNCTYTQQRNTPFQGLASDGAKLALWRITRDGIRIVGFLHDEIITEIPDDRPEQADAVKRHMITAMQEVLGGKFPVEISSSLGHCWVK